MFGDLTLSRRLERAEGLACARFIDARAAVSPDVGAAWMEVDGTLAMFDGPQSPLTQTFGLGMGPVSAATLDRVEAFFQERQAPVFHEVSPLADPALFALLHERGYAILEFTSVLWRPISPAHEARPGDGRVVARRVRSDEHGLWARMSVRGWSHLPELSDFVLSLEHLNPHRTDHVPFLAELNGEVVAAASLVMNEGVAILAGGSTVPEARRQGAQRALLEARLAYAAERGCDFAMMGALPGSDSQRNAERQSFRIAYTRIKWRLAR